MATLRLALLSRAENRQTFDDANSGAARWLAEQDLGIERARELDTVQHATRVSIDVPDSSDLSYLQAAWACLRWLTARGALVVQDLIGARWWDARTLLESTDDEFDIGRQIRVMYDADQVVHDPKTGKSARVLNTRGMRKFARPDLVVVVADRQRELAEVVLLQLADRMAHGWMPEGPRHGVDLPRNKSWYLHPADDREPLVAELCLANDALIVRNEQGQHIGFARG
jgi:hypothetical protein